MLLAVLFNRIQCHQPSGHALTRKHLVWRYDWCQWLLLELQYRPRRNSWRGFFRVSFGDRLTKTRVSNCVGILLWIRPGIKSFGKHPLVLSWKTLLTRLSEYGCYTAWAPFPQLNWECMYPPDSTTPPRSHSWKGRGMHFRVRIPISYILKSYNLYTALCCLAYARNIVYSSLPHYFATSNLVRQGDKQPGKGLESSNHRCMFNL